MSKRWMTILVAAVFLLGLTVLLYPTAAHYYMAQTQARLIESYNRQVEAESEARYQTLLSDSMAYNQRLYQKGPLSTVLNAAETDEYQALLNLRGDGVMGYVEIPKIGVSLPIAHGTDESTLQQMVGHLQGSSLPVEGDNVHAIISAHRGLSSARLFTDLDALAIGDTFTIHVLDKAYGYRVDDISVILPEETAALNIIPGGNYVTLMTCTPYGVNTHRLLVRGAFTGEAAQMEAASAGMSERERRERLIVAGSAVLAALAAGALLLRRRKRGKK